MAGIGGRTRAAIAGGSVLARSAQGRHDLPGKVRERHQQDEYYENFLHHGTPVMNAVSW
ncbi:MAG: hypothetical protein LKM39_10720 [Chiayiivirga sp.]|nr:hypothetical protein [Chiayiivirga sp.]